MKYVPTIGLEVHAELATKSKMFCACVNDPDEEKPNANICPVCMAHPGTLPVLNHEAIKHVLKIGHAVKGNIADFTEWDRKQYFYPDIPKGYQISQYKYPLVSGGELAGVALTRIHLEEDTAQSTHDAPGLHVADKSLVNYNRAGVPLMELVTEPVIHDAETALRFAKELQLLLRCLGSGEANMEKGEMRVEVNISIATPEDTAARKFGTKTEVKNINSFRAVERSIVYEIARHTRILEAAEIERAAGKEPIEKIVQETRGWDESSQKTFSQRAKESAHDYRYFPDPDIPKLKVSEVADFAPAALTKEMPELPWEKRARYKTAYEMTDKEVAVCVESEIISEYFEKTIAPFSSDKKLVRLAINYILSDYVGTLKKEFGEGEFVSHMSIVPPEQFAKLIQLIGSGKVNSRGGKDTLSIMYAEGKVAIAAAASGAPVSFVDPEMLAEKNGFIQKNDEGEIKKIAEAIVAANPAVAADYKAGKAAALQFFIGQGMKATKGSANPELLKTIFMSIL
ncbi:MAG: gatB [Candidatus Taylorbacteria bacterium]|nr:gatB [Candidatus Taylorbacteria bacterium]